MEKRKKKDKEKEGKDEESLIPSEILDQELKVELARSREALKEYRGRRKAPSRDEKVLTGWNGFVLRALSEAGVVLGREDYLRAAKKNADFLLGSLRSGPRLLRSWREEPGRTPGFLEDYAALGNALLTLHEATLEPRWLEEGRKLADLTVDLFWEGEAGTFYDTPRDGEKLIVRPRDVMDNATPSGNSLAVELLMRAGRLFGEDRYLELAERALGEEEGEMGRLPSAFGRLLSLLTSHLSFPLEVVLLGPAEAPEMKAMLLETHRPYVPNKVVLGGDPSSLPPLPLLEGRAMRDGQTTAYICRDYSCGPPIVDAMELASEIKGEG